MSSDLLPLAEASDLLGVSVERVRQLVVSGRLPGVRFGNVWVVPRGAVVARRHSRIHGGRPLRPLRAWNEIVSGRVDPSHADRFLRRAAVRRCEMSRADIKVLRSRFGALVGGAQAAVAY